MNKSVRLTLRITEADMLDLEAEVADAKGGLTVTSLIHKIILGWRIGRLPKEDQARLAAAVQRSQATGTAKEGAAGAPEVQGDLFRQAAAGVLPKE